MSKTDGWNEGDTLVMQETYSYQDAQHMAEFEELMSWVVESDVEELDMAIKLDISSSILAMSSASL